MLFLLLKAFFINTLRAWCCTVRWNEGHAYPALETLHSVSVSIQYTLADVNIYMKLQSFLSSSVHASRVLLLHPLGLLLNLVEVLCVQR